MVLEEAMRTGLIKNAPVYLDGMIMEATAIHAAYPEFLNRELREQIMVKRENPFMSNIFHKVETRDQRQEICDSVENQIVLATSGMMNGGPVMEFFKAWAPSAKNSLVFVGYQADGTLGRRIQRGVDEITLSDGGKQVKYEVKMAIETAEGFSGHSDKKQLLAYISTMHPKPYKILVNHGDGEKTVSIRGIASDIYRKILQISSETGKTVGELTNEAYRKMVQTSSLVEKAAEKALEKKFKVADTIVENIGQITLNNDEVEKLYGNIGFRNIDTLELAGLSDINAYGKISFISNVKVLKLTKGTKKVNLLSKLNDVSQIVEENLN